MVERSLITGVTQRFFTEEQYKVTVKDYIDFIGC